MINLTKTEALGLLASLSGFSDDKGIKNILSNAGKPLAVHWLEASQEEKEEALEMSKKGLESLSVLFDQMENLLKD